MPAGNRIRGNNAFGTTVDNPLTAGATTLTSVELALLPEVTAAHAVITLDPLRQNGEPEIIVVTTHNPGAQTATVVRGQYGTVARSHPQGTVWVHAPVNDDVIVIASSSSLPLDPYEGQLVYEADTDRFVARMGGAWLGLIPAGVISAFGGTTAPTSWLLCDGSLVSTTTYADLFAIIGHEYNGGVDPGGGQFRLPNLQDRFPLGQGTTFNDLGGTGGSATSTASHTHNLSNHTHGLQSHTHDLSNHTHTFAHNHSISDPGHNHDTSNDGTHFHAAINQFVITHNADPHRTALSGGGQQLTFTSNTSTSPSAHNHVITSRTTGISVGGIIPGGPTSGPTSNTSGGPSNNTSAGPSNNTSDGSSAAIANGNMPPYQIVRYIIKY